MKLNTVRRNAGIATAVLALSLSLAACSEDEEPTTGSDSATSEAPETEAPEETEAAGAGADTFGEGCAAVPADGDGSFDGMVDDPVATAASANPVLSTLVTAVTEADLVDTLNNADALTVFAPSNDAFAAIPKKDLNALLADKKGLMDVLTLHVVPGQLGPDEVAGKLEALNGKKITVEGDAESGVTVNDANVICGNVQTANATVYIIDSVLS